MYLWLLKHYIVPQVMGRRPYETIWKILYDAYRMKMKISDLPLRDDEKKLVEALNEQASKKGNSNSIISDTLIFDTVDRLANLTHFIMWKDNTPVQFNPPRNFQTPLEDMFYSPTLDKYKCGNCVLEWNIGREDVYRKSRIVAREFYLYGIDFVISDVNYQLEVAEDGKVILKDFGTTFEPISLKKVWINYQLPISKMELQPCPFFYESTSDFQIINNAYDPATNPFGFANLQEIGKDTNVAFMSSGEEVWKQALQERLGDHGTSLAECEQFPKIRSLWNFYPMMPFDPKTGEWEKRSDGSPVPYTRMVWQHYGSDLMAGRIVPLRLQEANFYDELPLYGSAHIEDLDSGAYPLSICEALLDYSKQLNKCMAQYLTNKDLINDPPSWHTVGTPSVNADVNKCGVRVQSLGPQDFGWRQVPDATASTAAVYEQVRDRAQTTAKVVDALVGRAMGGRTTATEAQNAFQAAMSGVTTDINLFNKDNLGGYAKRTWTYALKWFDIDLIKVICGSYGLLVTADDLKLQISLKTDVGSTFIESIVKQQHLRYAIEAGMRSPALDQGELWLAFAKETRIHEIAKAVVPDQSKRDIALAKRQAEETFLDKPFMINPNQNHDLATTVKTRYLEDKDSAWMQNYGGLPYSMLPNMTRAQVIAAQIQIHQNYMVAIMQEQMKIQSATLQSQMEQQLTLNPPKPQQTSPGGAQPKTGGEAQAATNPASTTR